MLMEEFQNSYVEIKFIFPRWGVARRGPAWHGEAWQGRVFILMEGMMVDYLKRLSKEKTPMRMIVIGAILVLAGAFHWLTIISGFLIVFAGIYFHFKREKDGIN